MTDKGIKGKTRREKEEEYFAHQELLKRKALREKLDKERHGVKAAASHPHWMKCPKCGGELEELAFADLMIDKCKGCAGIFLDAGELELLIGAQKAKGFFSKFMEAVGGSGD